MSDSSEQSDKREIFISDGKQMCVYDPRTGKHELVNDAREEMQEITKQNPTSEEEKTAFYSHRRKLLEKAELSIEQKKALEDSIEKSLDSRSDAPPVPGGVGAGVWYRNGQLLFGRSTALYHYIVIPEEVGGATNTWLYLTATNRAAKGVEAFASYFAQENPVFKVFDWAKPEGQHWSREIPYSRLGKYILRLTLGNQTLQALYVINITRKTGETSWINEVLLHNGETGARDLIYSYSYTLSSNQQQQWGGWGPIVETFQDDYGDTNTLGFLESLIIQDGVERHLTELTTFIEDNKHGIQMFHRVPNHSFLAR